MSNCICLYDVNVTLGSKQILNSITFTIESGKISTLLGPNGSGKTTTIKTILGLIKANSGKIVINEAEVKCPYNVETKRRFLYIPDEPILIDYLTGYENLRYFAALYEAFFDKKSVDNCLQKYKLLQDKDTLVKNYSRGMKQKLCLSLIQIYNPEIIILDEPTNGLDVISITSTIDLLKTLANEGKTILIATHDVSFCTRLTNNLIFISSGNIVSRGNLDWYINKHGTLENAIDTLL